MNSFAVTIICILLGLALAVRGLFRPFLGLLVFLAIHFVQPGELVPALAPLRIELVYGVLLVGTLVFKRGAEARSRLLSDRILRGAVLVIAVGVLSVPFAIWQSGAAETVLDMLKLVTLMVMMDLLITSEYRLRSMLWSMAAIGAWFAGSSLFAYYHGDYYHLNYNLGDLDRAEGMNSMVGDPNSLAGLLLALLPLLIALLRTTRNIFVRMLLIACGAVSLLAISLTGSRIAMIGLLAIGIYYALQSKRKVLTFTAALIIACLLWNWMPQTYRQRYLTIQSYAGGGELDASNQVRLEIWKAGQQIFLLHPIIGVGAGQFANAYGMIYLAGRSGDWMQPHNLLIQVTCELGIIGLGVFVYFLWQIAKEIGVVLRQKGKPRLELIYQVGIACSVMYVGVLILSTVGHTLYRPYWYLLGGLVAANKAIAEEKLKASKSVRLDRERPKKSSKKKWHHRHDPTEQTRPLSYAGRTSPEGFVEGAGKTSSQIKFLQGRQT